MTASKNPWPAPCATSRYVLAVLYDRDGGRRPEMIVTDAASYGDIAFGLISTGRV
ncbi:hypothetical protein ACFXA4_03900 [Streptomyces sp. NPDC059442]|uniref:hypothetical protein n=1 Tax=Streptomyces sp. NPDC059442 TaxID=3346830 RepID=UPI0036B13E36